MLQIQLRKLTKLTILRSILVKSLLISASMGRFYYTKKTESDGLKKIQTWYLKKHGYFQFGWKSGTLTWTSSWSGDKSSISIESQIFDNESFIRLIYTQTDRDTGEKKEFDCKIPLTTNPCHFGGKRYWFVCSVFKSGNYCGRRVGVLYKAGDYFACRHCYDLSYNSRNLGGFFKSMGQVISIPELEEQKQKVKRKYYAGKMTRRYKQYLKKERKSYYQLVIASKGLRKKLDK